MRLSISTPFDNALIDGIKDTAVTQVFGKLNNDYVGGGLEPHNLASASSDKKSVEDHVKYAHKHGLTFNYTLNAPCLDNREFTNEGRGELRKLLDWISEAGVDEVTVANPQFIGAINSATMYR